MVSGGTGGHVYPLIAVGNKLKELAVQNNVELEIKAITDSETWKQEFEKIGVPAFIISAGKWRRYASFQNFLDIF